jgi:glycosyltransferase involved in cell wall biosynthesis
MHPTCSLVISTYNSPKALRLCLESVLAQSVKPNEIVIADDGSGEATKLLIEEFQKNSTIPLQHVWHKDNGYQLSAIRNKAFAVCKFDYIIQIDGDLILHHHFVKDHLNFAKGGMFASGARTNINEATTKKFLQQKTTERLYYFSKGLEKRYNAFRLGLLKFINKHVQKSAKNMLFVLGCNMAFWKKDLLKVNGYNEEFTAWGKEDNDIAARLMNAGVKCRFLKFGAVVFHLWHKEADRGQVSANEEKFLRSVNNKITWVANGIDKQSPM